MGPLFNDIGGPHSPVTAICGIRVPSGRTKIWHHGCAVLPILKLVESASLQLNHISLQIFSCPLHPPDINVYPNMAMRRYQYSPLPGSRHIRLLRLHRKADTEHSQLSVNLVIVSLDAAPPFEAVSYAWGDPSPQAEIRCCGLTARIGLSLHSALRQLAPGAPKPERLLWVDALCINQDDIAERNSQVQMMGEIYARATNTLIWLGDEDDDIARAMMWLQRFHEAWKVIYPERTESDTSSFCGRMGVNSMAEAEKALQSAFLERRIEAYSSIWMLFRRPWFKRKWVIQEVAKSTKHGMMLLSGSKRLEWQAIQAWSWFLVTSLPTLIKFLASYPWGSDSSSDAYTDFIQARMLALMRDREAPLMLLLSRTLPFRCTDPRDHVIALVGISTDGSSHENFIDYDIAAEDLYDRLAHACLNNPQDLSILWSFVSIVPVDRRGSSSWMPRIAELPAMPGLALQSLEVSQTFQVIRDSPRSARLDGSISGNRLQVKGRIVDRLEQLGTDMSASSELGNFVQIMDTKNAQVSQNAIASMDRWLDQCWAIAQAAKQDDDSYLSAVLAEEIMKVQMPETIAAARKDFSVYRRAQKAAVSAVNEASWSQALASFAAKESLFHLEILMLRMIYRRFSRTLHGSIGWSPRVAEVGDLICVFDGMELPYAVRPKEDTEGVYSLVGECFIAGLMDEKAIGTGRVKSIAINLE